MTNEEKKAVTEQVVRVQNELAKLQNLLQDEPEESNTPSAAFDCLAVTQVQVFPFKDLAVKLHRIRIVDIVGQPVIANCQCMVSVHSYSCVLRKKHPGQFVRDAADCKISG